MRRGERERWRRGPATAPKESAQRAGSRKNHSSGMSDRLHIDNRRSRTGLPASVTVRFGVGDMDTPRFVDLDTTYRVQSPPELPAARYRCCLPILGCRRGPAQAPSTSRHCSSNCPWPIRRWIRLVETMDQPTSLSIGLPTLPGSQGGAITITSRPNETVALLPRASWSTALGVAAQRGLMGQQAANC
jgi:hypothetical protein